MSVAGGVAPSVLDTLEFPAALERVSAHAAGPLGAARVRGRTPAADAEAIRAALAQVAELAALLLHDDAIRAEPVPDIGPPLELLAVAGSALEGVQLVVLTRALAAARLTAAELARLARDAPRTAALRVDPPPKEIETRLAHSLDAEGVVLDAASRSLARARQGVREARQRLVARLDAMLGALDPTDRAPDAAVTLRGGRYVIPIRSTARARVGGIVHDESATRSTVFVEPPEVIELGNALRAAEAEEQREVLRVLRELTDLVRPQRAALAAAWEMCIAFDDLCARARYAVEVNGFAPAIGAGPLAIRNGRHPLLVPSSPRLVSSPSPGGRGGQGVRTDGTERGSGGEDAVPFDLVLAPDEVTILVSGPNTGGKTVLIKAVGLLCLMAQSGIIPPLGPQSTLPVFDAVFADIGDRQSIAASLSTFSAHVAALRDILEHATAGSLVLLDEIGSGTDPAEGGALAAAVLRTLTRRRVVTLATTHLGALKQLAAQTVGIVNASLQFEAETLTPTYRLLKGVPGRSYGLAIARRLGVPTDVLDLAERAVPDAERALDALLATVEARARELEAKQRELAERDTALREDAARVDARAEDLARREREVTTRAQALEREAREQTRAYLLEARRKVEEALGRARAAVDEATAREARRLLETAIEETELPEKGNVKRETWLSLEELRRLKQEPSDAPRRVPRPAGPARGAERPTATAASEISLRGLRLDEAEPMLVRALDDAVAADLPYLRVIHGKGTGAVRKLVHELLSADPRVKRFGFAPANQGGHGVTIVEFTA
ncbi:MAG TPA: Smr/MutS family protein [Gemmatimonadales bacterium]|nr:Smr/MutS family protein [Gemmatimonadales bacterium]